MKKRFLLFISIMLLLTGCNSKPKEKDITVFEGKEYIELDISDKTGELIIEKGKELLAEEEGYCDIIYFDSKQAIFTKTGDINKEYDTVNTLFYYYDINSGETVFLTEVKDVYSSTQDIAYLNNRVYYPLSMNGKKGTTEYILEISLNDFSSRLVKSKETKSRVTRLEATKDEIYRYYQKDLSEDETDFFIDNIGELGAKENIIYEKYKNKSGNILVSACLYEDNIYAYSINYDDTEEYMIQEYSLQGDLLQQYKMDLKEFLKIKEVDDTDVVYRIFRVGDYIILNTLNNRVKIYKVSESELIEVKTPKVFEELLGARVIENYGQQNRYVYFADSSEGNKFYFFDTEDGKIRTINIVGNDIASFNIMRDAEGNIVVVSLSPENEYRYYFIKCIDIINKVKN